MNIGCAVQSRSNRNIKSLIQNATDLCGRERLAAKAQRAYLPREIPVAEDRITADLIEPAPEVFEQCHFVLALSKDAMFLNVLDSGRQSGHSEHIGRAAFEKIRELDGLCLA